MSAVYALIAISGWLLVVLYAIGIQSLQAWLERWDYDRHFND